MFVTLKQTT